METGFAKVIEAWHHEPSCFQSYNALKVDDRAFPWAPVTIDHGASGELLLKGPPFPGAMMHTEAIYAQRLELHYYKNWGFTNPLLGPSSK